METKQERTQSILNGMIINGHTTAAHDEVVWYCAQRAKKEAGVAVTFGDMADALRDEIATYQKRGFFDMFGSMSQEKIDHDVFYGISHVMHLVSFLDDNADTRLDEVIESRKIADSK